MSHRPHSITEFDADEQDALRAAAWQPTAGRSACPDPSVLTALEDGVLDAAAAAPVRAHVEACALCRQLAADLGAVFEDAAAEDASGRIAARIHAGARRPRPVRFWGLVATGGGLAAAAGLSYFLLMTPALAPPDPAGPPATIVARGIPTVFQADRPVVAPADIDLTVRGDTTSRLRLPDQIGAALDVMEAGDAGAAVAQLASLADQYRDSRDAHLALGGALLAAARPVEALAPLERARALVPGGAADSEVEWFLAIALVQTGARDRAKTVLEPLCSRGGPRSARACAGLAELNSVPDGK